MICLRMVVAMCQSHSCFPRDLAPCSRACVTWSNLPRASRQPHLPHLPTTNLSHSVKSHLHKDLPPAFYQEIVCTARNCALYHLHRDCPAAPIARFFATPSTDLRTRRKQSLRSHGQYVIQKEDPFEGAARSPAVDEISTDHRRSLSSATAESARPA